MREALASSAYFGVVLSVAAYSFGLWMKKKTGLAVCNPLLVAVIIIVPVLLATHITYDEYMKGAESISYLLTPATVCLAIPLYKQLALLKKNKAAVLCGIAAGVAANALTIFVLCLLAIFDVLPPLALANPSPRPSAWASVRRPAES